LKKLALKLGLTVGLYTFVFNFVAGWLLDWMDWGSAVYRLVPLAMLVLAFVCAHLLASKVESEDAIPEALPMVLLVTAAFWLLMSVLQMFGVGGSIFRFLRYPIEWALPLSLVLVMRLLKPRYMLFVALFAFALQLHSGALLGVLLLKLPNWAGTVIDLTVALLVARWLALGDESPADRVQSPGALWGFSAAAVLVLFIAKHGYFFRVYLEQAVWIAFLVTFCLTVSNTKNENPHRDAPALGASGGLIVLMFVGLFCTVATVFHVHEIVSGKISFSAGRFMQVGVPAIVCAVVAGAIMVWLGLGQRMQTDSPGRGALLWGVILFFVGVLLGGSIFGAAADSGQVIQLVAIVYVLLLVGPILALSMLLIGIGVLRILFNLAPRS